MRRKYLSRRIIVVENGIEKIYPISIAEVDRDESGRILGVSIIPYSEEIPGVEYVDGELRLEL